MILLPQRLTRHVTTTCVALLLAASSLSTWVVATGGELATFTEPQMTTNLTYRQDLCNLYNSVENGDLELKDALNGVKLNTIMGNYEGSFFNYDPVRGCQSWHTGRTDG